MHAIFNELEQLILKNLNEGVALDDMLSAINILKLKLEHAMNTHLNAAVMQKVQQNAANEAPRIIS